MLEMIGSYDEAWKAIISPPRQEYSVNDLGPTEFAIKNNRIKRTDFRLLNNRGHVIECSFFEHTNIQTPVPCVVYLHGNGCSRMEALQYLDTVLSEPVSFFCFDFNGCGKSHGQYTSIGWHEQDDLDCIIQYLYNCEKVSKIAVWGRSMGAITALFYANKDPRVKCFIFDSPFSSFKQMVKELVQQKTPVPDFVVTGALKMIRKTILKKANFDIDALKPSKFVDRLKIPALFGAAREDVLVSAQHTRDLFNAYGGLKDIMIFEGDHNSKRPIEWKIRVQTFIKTHLIDNGNEDVNRLKPFKQYFYSQYNPEDVLSTNCDSPLYPPGSHYLSKPLEKSSTSTSTQPEMKLSWLDQSSSVHTQDTTEEKRNIYYVGQKSIDFSADTLREANLNTSANSPYLPESTPTKALHTRKAATYFNPSESNNWSTAMENASISSLQSIDSFRQIEAHNQDIIKNTNAMRPSFHKHSATLKDISSFGLNGQSDMSAGSPHWREQANAKGLKVFTPKSLMSDLQFSASAETHKSPDFSRLSSGNHLSQYASAGLPAERTFHKKNLSNFTHSYGIQGLQNNDYSPRMGEDDKCAKVRPCHQQKKKSMMLQVKLNLDVPVISTSGQTAQTARTSMADFLARNLYQERNSVTVTRDSMGYADRR